MLQSALTPQIGIGSQISQTENIKTSRLLALSQDSLRPHCAKRQVWEHVTFMSLKCNHESTIKKRVSNQNEILPTLQIQ